MTSLKLSEWPLSLALYYGRRRTVTCFMCPFLPYPKVESFWSTYGRTWRQRRDRKASYFFLLCLLCRKPIITPIRSKLQVCFKSELIEADHSAIAYTTKIIFVCGSFIMIRNLRRDNLKSSVQHLLFVFCLLVFSFWIK